MDIFGDRYAQTLFQRAYPMPAPEETLSQTAGRAMAPPKDTTPAPKPAPMTTGDAGKVVGESLAGIAKGAVEGSLGMFGDIRQLVDMIAEETAKKVLGERSFPSTEEVRGSVAPLLPEGKEIDPRHRQAVSSAQAVGEVLPVAPVAITKALVKAIRKGKPK